MQPALAVPRDVDLVPLADEDLLEHRGELPVVLDQEQLRGFGHRILPAQHVLASYGGLVGADGRGRRHEGTP